MTLSNLWPPLYNWNYGDLDNTSRVQYSLTHGKHTINGTQHQGLHGLFKPKPRIGGQEPRECLGERSASLFYYRVHPKMAPKGPGLLPGFPGSLVCQDQIKSRQGPGTQLASSPTVTKFPALSRKKTGQDWDFIQECVFIEEFVRKKDEPSVKRGDVASKQQGGMRPGWLPRSQCFQHDRLPSWQHWTRHTTASSSHPPSSPLLSVPQPWVPHSQVPMAF